MNLMRIMLYVVLMVTVQFTGLYPEEQWEEFKKTRENYYYFLESTDLSNFSCLFTTESYIDFIEAYQDSSYYYPLKLIWTDAGKIYYILHTHPAEEDKQKRKELMEKIQLTKNQYQGVYLDILNFLIVSPFVDIPEKVTVDYGQDTVSVFYTSPDDSLVKVTKSFLINGRLSKVVVESARERVLNYPMYREVDGKWLCVGWDTLLLQDNEVMSGMATRLELTRLDRYWLPVRADILVQSKDLPGERFLSTIFMKDYQLNIPLQELEEGESPASSGQE